MPLRERKDCTDDELVPNALAIHSSLRPSSTHRLMSSTNFLSEILWLIPMTATASDLHIRLYKYISAHIHTCPERPSIAQYA